MGCYAFKKVLEDGILSASKHQNADAQESRTRALMRITTLFEELSGALEVGRRNTGEYDELLLELRTLVVLAPLRDSPPSVALAGQLLRQLFPEIRDTRLSAAQSVVQKGKDDPSGSAARLLKENGRRTKLHETVSKCVLEANDGEAAWKVFVHKHSVRSFIERALYFLGVDATLGGMAVEGTSNGSPAVIPSFLHQVLHDLRTGVYKPVGAFKNPISMGLDDIEARRREALEQGEDEEPEIPVPVERTLKSGGDKEKEKATEKEKESGKKKEKEKEKELTDELLELDNPFDMNDLFKAAGFEYADFQDVVCHRSDDIKQYLEEAENKSKSKSKGKERKRQDGSSSSDEEEERSDDAGPRLGGRALKRQRERGRESKQAAGSSNHPRTRAGVRAKEPALNRASPSASERDSSDSGDSDDSVSGSEADVSVSVPLLPPPLGPRSRVARILRNRSAGLKAAAEMKADPLDKVYQPTVSREELAMLPPRKRPAPWTDTRAVPGLGQREDSPPPVGPTRATKRTRQKPMREEAKEAEEEEENKENEEEPRGKKKKPTAAATTKTSRAEGGGAPATPPTAPGGSQTPRSVGVRHRWSDSETNRLIDGVREFGVGRWLEIQGKYNLKSRSTVDLKDRWRTLIRQIKRDPQVDGDEIDRQLKVHSQLMKQQVREEA